MFSHATISSVASEERMHALSFTFARRFLRRFGAGVISAATTGRTPNCGSSCASGLVAGAHGHPQGRSPFGLEDVLLTRGELLGPDLDASGRGCLPTGQGCVVSGIEANAIDAIADIPEQSNINPISMMGAIYSFRCAWEGNGT